MATDYGEEVGEECETPKNSRIPAAFVCPPPPKKKAGFGKRKDPPANGYFIPPDLELLFAALPGRRAWA
ncbi:unnamed protein product [Victoria cruziana]